MPLKFGLDISRAPRPVRESKEPIIRFFSFHDAHPIALGMVCMEKFGVEWFEWSPEALRHAILKEFKATSISEHNWQKIQAFRTLLLVTSPWSEWEVFENIIQALNNNVPDIHLTQVCTLSQLMAGVDTINQIRDEEFGDEVEGYVAACAMDAGVTFLPEPLDFAQDRLSEPQYECLDCGNVDAADLNDGRCDVCCERFSDDRPLNQQPNPQLPASCGTNIRTFLKRDPTKVWGRFGELKKSTTEINEDSPVDVQALKLLVAHKYTQQRRKELVEQLEELKGWVST